MDDFVEKHKIHQIRDSAERDRHLSIFRRIWDSLKPGQKNELKAILHTLDHVQSRLGAITGWKLQAPNVASGGDMDWPQEVLDADPIARELCAMAKFYIAPAEYLCAINCWDDGRSYVPLEHLVWNHPDWPYIDPFTAAEPAPEPPPQPATE